jgi:thymidylate synthase (FAD)
MCEVKLHLKLPIFVMRQLVRHRTSSLNEYSGRYSIMTDEFYVPDLADIKPQSSNNKQCSESK